MCCPVDGGARKFEGWIREVLLYPRPRMMASYLVEAIVVVLLILTSQLLGCATAGYHHTRVVPDQSNECEDSQHCFTFSEALIRADEVFISSTLVVFSAGEYNINNTRDNLTISGVSNLSLAGPHSASGQVHINCHTRFRFDFIDSSDVTIANIVFSGCGSWSKLSSGALIFMTVSSLIVANVTIQHSHGYGLIGLHLSGDITVYNSVFLNNSRREGYSSRFKVGGNCLLHTTNIYKLMTPTVLTISGSTFVNGTAEDVAIPDTLSEEKQLQPISGGGGLAIYYMQHLKDHSRIHGSLTIINSTFLNNTAQYGGNLLFLIYSKGCDSLSNYYVSITAKIMNSTFQGGQADFKGGGLSFEFNPHQTKLRTLVSGSRFINNKAQKGGGLSFSIYKNTVPSYGARVTLLDLLVTQNQADKGGGLYAEHDHKTQIVYIQNGLISFNYAVRGGGIYLIVHNWSEESLKDILSYVDYVVATVKSTNISENKAKFGSAIGVQRFSSELEDIEACPFPAFAAVLLNNVTIHTNSLSEGTMYYGAAVVHVESIQWTILKDTTFYNNTGGGIYANNSFIAIVGEVSFKKNYGYYGGAIQLDCICDSSYLQPFLFLGNTSFTSIAQNRAVQYGGGIGIPEVCSKPNMCFYQMLDWDQTEYHATVEMKDNLAGIAGDDIYGASKTQCDLLNGTILVNASFHQIFKLRNKTLSSISSLPYHVCFCKHNSPKSYCLNSVEKTVFPGQEFTISATTVGNHRGASPATVQSQFIGLGVHAELGTRQSVQKLGRTCGDLTYSIKTTQSTIQLYLTVQGVKQTILSAELPAIINVTILPCPLGFTEVGNPPLCGCMPHLSLAGVVCDINTQTHQGPADMWIGNVSGDIVTHPHCPFDYCKPGQFNVSLTSQHEQCQYSRHGVLCGECQRGLSLTLGSSQCQKCSSVYLLLFLPFTVAGVALVFMLLKCNLTVSTGNINGLIFYANIIRVNNAIFFPKERGGVFVGFLFIFVAWLNLDLGIQVCFFDGLNAFGRAWLQFLFPAYIWILAGIMIFGSKYSTRMTKVTGNNAVPVLATLFLLSYAKLLRIVIDGISFTTITGVSGDVTAVWLVDGNLLFLNMPHVFLFLMSLITAFAHIIPFTVVVLMAPYLQARSNHRLLHWVNRIKPFLDTYQGPYRDQFRFWAGFTLVIRAILFIIFASNTLGDPRVNLLAIITTLLLLLAILWNTGRVYKSFLAHSIECFYILNLGVYTAATLYLTSSGASPHKQGQLVGVMVGSAFIVFCGIILYHLYTLTKSIDVVKMCSSHVTKWQCRWLNKTKRSKVNTVEVGVKDNGTELSTLSPSQPTMSVVNFNRLREPLIED